MPQNFNTGKEGWYCPSCECAETLHRWICQSCFWNCYETRYIDCADTIAYQTLVTKDWRSEEVRAIIKSLSKGNS